MLSPLIQFVIHLSIHSGSLWTVSRIKHRSYQRLIISKTSILQDYEEIVCSWLESVKLFFFLVAGPRIFRVVKTAFALIHHSTEKVWVDIFNYSFWSHLFQQCQLSSIYILYWPYLLIWTSPSCCLLLNRYLRTEKAIHLWSRARSSIMWS